MADVFDALGLGGIFVIKGRGGYFAVIFLLCSLCLFVHTHPNSNVDVVGVDPSSQVLADPLLAEELL